MKSLTTFAMFPFVASSTVAVVAIHVVVADAGVFTRTGGAFVNVCNMHRKFCEKPTIRPFPEVHSPGKYE
jgi:hypothetical protein